MKRYALTIHGRVQGVGFRYSVKLMAYDLDTTGFVKNLEDGSVYIEVQGNDESLEIFMKKLGDCDRFAKIIHISCSEIQYINEERSFEIQF